MKMDRQTEKETEIPTFSLLLIIITLRQRKKIEKLKVAEERNKDGERMNRR